MDPAGASTASFVSPASFAAMLAAVFVAAFALGAIPSALWVGRAARGVDLRQHGSGNLGATNVYRVLGPKWGLLVLALDAAKGALAVLLAPGLAGLVATAPRDGASADWIWIVALVGAVLGHMFSPIVRFRGGKGVATAAGAWLAIVPAAAGLALGAWVVVFAWRRVVSLASIVAALVLPVALVAARGFRVEDPILWTGLAIAALVILRHRENIGRLVRGEERALRGPGKHAS